MNCIVCNCEIIPDRVKFLLENNKEMTCTKHAQPVSIKALYSGEYGTSELIFCDRIYDDSVRTKLYNSETQLNDDGDFEEEEDLNKPTDTDL